MATAWRKIAGGLLAMGWIALLLATLFAGCAARRDNGDTTPDTTVAAATTVQTEAEKPAGAASDEEATVIDDENATREGGVLFEGDMVVLTLDADTLAALGGGPEDFTGAGFESVEATGNGGVALTMTAAYYEELMDELREGILAQLAAIEESGEEYPSIESIVADDDFTTFTMVVWQQPYEEGDESVVEMLLALYSITWQVYSGEVPQAPAFVLVDAESGEEYDSFSLAS